MPCPELTPCLCPKCTVLEYMPSDCTVRWRCQQCTEFDPAGYVGPTGFWYYLEAEPLPDTPSTYARPRDYGPQRPMGRVAAIPGSRYTLTWGGPSCPTQTKVVDTPVDCACGQGCAWNLENQSYDLDIRPNPAPTQEPWGLIWDVRDTATLILSGITRQELYSPPILGGGYAGQPLRTAAELAAWNHTSAYPVLVGDAGAYRSSGAADAPIIRGCKMHYVPSQANTFGLGGPGLQYYVYDIANFITWARWAEGTADELYAEATWAAEVWLADIQISHPVFRPQVTPPVPDIAGAALVMLRPRLVSHTDAWIPTTYYVPLPGGANSPAGYFARRIMAPGVDIVEQTANYKPWLKLAGSAFEPVSLASGASGWPGLLETYTYAHHGWCYRSNRYASIVPGEARERPSSVCFHVFSHGRYMVPMPFFDGAMVWESLWAPTA